MSPKSSPFDCDKPAIRDLLFFLFKFEETLTADFALRLKVLDTSERRSEKPLACLNGREDALDDKAEVNDAIFDNVPENSPRATTSSCTDTLGETNNECKEVEFAANWESDWAMEEISSGVLMSGRAVSNGDADKALIAADNKIICGANDDRSSANATAISFSLETVFTMSGESDENGNVKALTELVRFLEFVASDWERCDIVNKTVCKLGMIVVPAWNSESRVCARLNAKLETAFKLLIIAAEVVKSVFEKVWSSTWIFDADFNMVDRFWKVVDNCTICGVNKLREYCRVAVIFVPRLGSKEDAKARGEIESTNAEDSSEVWLRVDENRKSGDDKAWDKGGDKVVDNCPVEVESASEAIE